MYLALFLHLYQPPTQFAKVLKSITDDSYRRLLTVIWKYPSAKLTINVSGSLTEQLAAHADLRRCLADLADLVEKGQVELVGSAAYHPLLTEIPRDEIRRQILLNDAINKRYFGDMYNPRGLFPPEMAVNRQVLEVVAEMGFDWILVDESAIKTQKSIRHWRIKKQKSFINQGLRVFVRNSDLSIKIAFSQIRTVEELKKEISARELGAEGYVLLAMDGETFGHHRPEQFELLSQLFAASSKDEIQLVTISELQDLIKTEPVEVELQTSSWGPWKRWKNPENPIHQLQWKLFHLATKTVRGSKYSSENSENSVSQKISEPEDQNIRSSDTPTHRHTDTPSRSEFSESRQWLKARELLDKAIHSDQFWWASARPCWHYQMVERGARMLKNVVSTRQAKELYDKIIETGLKLHGKRVIE